ncbi:MAG TPA: fluoride efflux transporter CrcB [Gemmatimonadales bacterium]|jgi:CrcB protein|nr:fluoride efflux transporter CrcB [Gemmatimonadales bacterium]
MGIIWYVAGGSAVGGVLRYALGGWIARHSPGFPLGTLLINVTGSFLLGWLMRWSLGTPAISPEWRAALTIGLCGGYTTFSTFSYETMKLLQDGEWGRATLYAGLSIFVSLAAVFAGWAAGRVG